VEALPRRRRPAHRQHRHRLAGGLARKSLQPN
jgi:hypothetical protein